MRILIVEDDYLQADALQRALTREIPGARVERIATEERFRSSLDEIAREKPDVIVMDVMLRWGDPSPNLTEPPAEIRREGFRRAGIRCQKLIAENQDTRDIPVVLYSVLEESDLRAEIENLGGNVVYLPKNSSVTFLVEEILKRAQIRDGRPPRQP